MKRFLVWTLRAIGGLLFLFALGLGGGYLWLRGSLPQVAGERVIAGLSAPVEVLRDGDGIVTIRARDERDAARALGFVHAQDRLGQMDLMRRIGAGRLSEVIGPATLGTDRFMRTLGLYRVAEANLTQLSTPLRALLDAYAEGVNAFMDSPGKPWPPEFYILRYEPEPWKPADSLVWGRLMALQLSGNWTEELLRARLARRLKPEEVDFLWPPYPADAPVTLGDPGALYRGLPLRELGEILPWALEPKDASNFWVLAGSRTRSGRPILANDPHLSLGAPGTWYLVRIETPTLTLAGVTVPGMPFHILGHNGSIAWGLTTTHGDTQDLFVERLAEGDPSKYLTPDGPRAFETREEVIEVRGQEAERFTVRGTRHGPVISDAVPWARGAAEAGTVLALAWPALRSDDRSAEALYRLNRARDWRGFVDALRNWHSPQQNIAYADISGTIGFMAPARVPIRRRGDGTLPMPGWSGAYDWKGLIPFEDLPRTRDPARGRIVNANNRIVPDGYPYLIAAHWPAPYRAQRIHRMLDAGGRATPQSVQAMQQDSVSLGARDLLPLLLEATPETDRGQVAIAVLAEWDGRMARDRAAPLIFYAWLRELTRVLFADDLGDDFEAFQRPRPALVAKVLRREQRWCDDRTTEKREGCPAQLVTALEDALDLLALRFGRPVDRLRWGEAHVARFSHRVFSRLPLFDAIFGYAVATDGGGFTVNRASPRFTGPRDALFEDIHGPGYRAVYDLGDLDDSRFMIATGQSGNPLSPYYGSLAKRWRDGIYLKLDGTETESMDRLRLVPAGYPAGYEGS